MKFYITLNYYGGDVNIIEQAANECNVQLVAVKGIALEDFTEDREYVEGQAQCIFTVEGKTRKDIHDSLDSMQKRVSEMYTAQELSKQYLEEVKK